MCAAYGQYGHDVYEKTVIVGYACAQHSNRYSETEAPRREVLRTTTYQRKNPHERRSRRLQPTSSVPKSPEISSAATSDVQSAIPSAEALNETSRVVKALKISGNTRAPSIISSDSITDSTSSIFSRKKPQSLSETLSIISSVPGLKPPTKEQVSSLQPSPSLGAPIPNPLGSKGSESDKSQSSSTSEDTPDYPPISEPAGSLLSSSGTSIPPDIMAAVLDDFTARVRNPKAYLDRLQDLETTVFEGSTAEIYFPLTDLGYGNTNNSPLMAQYPDFHTTKKLEASISDTEALLLIKTKNVKKGNDFGAILESRNVLAKAVANIYRLQDAGYCATYISILAADNCRENVIRLVPIHVKDVVALFSRFEDCLRKGLDDKSSPPQKGSKATSKDSISSSVSSPNIGSPGEMQYSPEYLAPAESMHGKAVALFDFERENNTDLPLVKGQIIRVKYRYGEGWLVAEDPKTQESGLVPDEYIRLLRDIQGEVSVETLQKTGVGRSNDGKEDLETQNEKEKISQATLEDDGSEARKRAYNDTSSYPTLPRGIAASNLEGSDKRKVSMSGEANPVIDLIDACAETLQLVLPISREDILESQYIATIRLTAHLIDLAVLSYSGAHVNDFGKHCALETPRIFDLLNPFSGSLFRPDENQPFPDDYLADEEMISIQMQQCHLLCLDAFHDEQPVWVFSSPLWAPTAKLLLSTFLEPFADIWGPLWKAESVTQDPIDHKGKGALKQNVSTVPGETSDRGDLHTPFHQKQPSYLHYVVGNGRIVKWPQSEYSPILHNGEVFCHWISNREDVDSESLDWVGERPETASFDGTEIMLIGAFTIGKNHLTVNSKCQKSLSLARRCLIDSGKLRIHGTAEPYLYKDSISYQLQVGYSGVNASAGIQYKKIPGRNLKGILVEQWAMFPEIRRPELLEDLYGLEVSMCTKNAKRVQLSELLSRDCMRNLLRSFPWPSESYREDYFRALETNCFSKLDSSSDFRAVFGQAVLLSLSFLKETGVDRGDNLLVFLSSSATPKPELATLALKEHSWIGLLRDSPDSCTMAMFGDNCLEFKHETGSSCGNLGRTTLRTNLTLNNLQPPPSFLNIKALPQPSDDSGDEEKLYWGSWWLGSEESVGCRMWLGKHGTFSVLQRLSDETFLVDWRASPVTCRSICRFLFVCVDP